MTNFWRKMLILNAKMLKIAPAWVAKIMTNFWRKKLILHAKTPKFAHARVAQIMINFWRKTLILHTKTPKFAPARVAQIMINFCHKMLILNAKKHTLFYYDKSPFPLIKWRQDVGRDFFSNFLWISLTVKILLKTITYIFPLMCPPPSYYPAYAFRLSIPFD